MSRHPLTRRELLLAGSALLAGCNAQKPQEGVLGALDRFTNRAEGLIQAPGRRASEPGARAVTPASAFPQYKIGDDFPDPPENYAVEIGGMVRTPLRLTVAELQRLEKTEMRVQHHCVEGWSAVASWHGVRLSALAAMAGVDPAARFVEFVSFEDSPMAEEAPPAEETVVHGQERDAKTNPLEMPRPKATTYTSSWDLQSALHPQTLLAYGMNGAPLPQEHGGPVRLYSSVKLGYKLVKWVSAVRFLPTATGGYWEDQGYEWFAGV